MFSLYLTQRPAGVNWPLQADWGEEGAEEQLQQEEIRARSQLTNEKAVLCLSANQRSSSPGCLRDT